MAPPLVFIRSKQPSRTSGARTPPLVVGCTQTDSERRAATRDLSMIHQVYHSLGYLIPDTSSPPRAGAGRARGCGPGSLLPARTSLLRLRHWWRRMDAHAKRCPGARALLAFTHPHMKSVFALSREALLRPSGKYRSFSVSEDSSGIHVW